MKVLIAVHGFPPSHISGAERTAERVAQWLVKHGHTVTVFTCEKLDDPNTRVETAVENGITLYRFYYDLKAGNYFENLYDDPRVGTAFRQILEQESFDLVHIFSGYLLGGQVINTAKAFHLPVVLTLTEFWFMCFRLNLLTANNEMCIGPETDEKCMRCVSEDQRRFRLPAAKAPVLMDAFWSLAKHLPFAEASTQAITKWRETLTKAIHAVDLVLCPSQFIITKFSEYHFDTSRFIHLRHGIRQMNKPADITGSSSNSLRLAYMGQIKVHKGVDLIIDAVLPLLDAGVPITVDLWGSSAGNDPYIMKLKERTARYPAIRWAGSYNNEQLPTVLSSFDVLIVPSRWYENSPAVILEAQTFKIPVLATRLGGMKELVHDETDGLLFELNDSSGLRAQIRRLLDDSDLLPRLRAAMPSIPTIDEEVSTIYAHYQELTGKV